MVTAVRVEGYSEILQVPSHTVLLVLLYQEGDLSTQRLNCSLYHTPTIHFGEEIGGCGSLTERRTHDERVQGWNPALTKPTAIVRGIDRTIPQTM